MLTQTSNLIAYTALVGASLILMYRFATLLRCIIRVDRNACDKCGYPRGNIASCTECGNIFKSSSTRKALSLVLVSTSLVTCICSAVYLNYIIRALPTSWTPTLIRFGIVQQRATLESAIEAFHKNPTSATYAEAARSCLAAIQAAHLAKSEESLTAMRFWPALGNLIQSE